MTKPTPEISEVLRRLAVALIEERLQKEREGSDRSELPAKAAGRSGRKGREAGELLIFGPWEAASEPSRMRRLAVNG